MSPSDLVRTFYESVASGHRLEDLPRFIGADCVLRQGERTLPLGPAGMARHLTALRETYPDYTIRVLRQYCDGPMSSPSVSWRAHTWAPGPGPFPRENA